MSRPCNYPLGDGKYCSNQALDGHVYCVPHRRRDPLAQQLDDEAVMTPPPDPLAELQALHDLHCERHLAMATTGDTDSCEMSRWLALCDRLAAAVAERNVSHVGHCDCLRQSRVSNANWVREYGDLLARLATVEHERDRLAALAEKKVASE